MTKRVDVYNISTWLWWFYQDYFNPGSWYIYLKISGQIIERLSHAVSHRKPLLFSTMNCCSEDQRVRLCEKKNWNKYAMGALLMEKWVWKPMQLPTTNNFCGSANNKLTVVRLSVYEGIIYLRFDHSTAMHFSVISLKKGIVHREYVCIILCFRR